MLTLTAPDSIAAYIRVSTHDQKTDSQREEISRWLRNHGIEPGSIRWYEDTETGKTLKRPAFQQLQKAIFAGEVKTVLVWKLDRLSRKALDGLHIMRFWLGHGVGIVSITQQLDMTGPAGQLFATLLFAISEFFLSTMKENQVAGIALAKQRGAYKGRKKGTTKAKPKDIRALRDKGLKIRQIAAAEGLSPRTVTAYLKMTVDGESSKK
jgi:DNA invertase Pin-like site-specific DNA recombinase